MVSKIRMFHDDKDWFTTYYNSRYTTRYTTQKTSFVPFIRSEHSGHVMITLVLCSGTVSHLVLGLFMTLLNLKQNLKKYLLTLWTGMKY